MGKKLGTHECKFCTAQGNTAKQLITNRSITNNYCGLPRHFTRNACIGSGSKKSIYQWNGNVSFNSEEIAGG